MSSTRNFNTNKLCRYLSFHDHLLQSSSLSQTNPSKTKSSEGTTFKSTHIGLVKNSVGGKIREWPNIPRVEVYIKSP